MLSAGASNALLKTLEEPPAYMIFILATTEPQKVLPTIRSRCQRYDFHRIPAAQIAARLADVLAQEKAGGAECEATPEAVVSLKPDSVVLAVGSTAVMPEVEGIDHPKVLGCIEALTHGERVGERVVVIGGGLVGCELSLDLVNKGHDVTIVEALPDILSAGLPVPLPNAMYLRDAFAQAEVPILTETRLISVTDAGAVVAAAEGTRTLAADTVVIAVGFQPRESMAQDLKGRGFAVFEVGDGRKVGNILTSIWDAYEVAHSL
jgi:2-enoate reductase